MLSNESKIMSGCCGEEIEAYMPVGNFIYRDSPPDPIEYCSGCGKRIRDDEEEFGIKVIKNDKQKS